MFKIFSTLGTALAAILSDRIVQAVSTMLTDGIGSLSDVEKNALERTINSQAIAAAVFQRFGIAGLASAFDAGLISDADLALYIVKGDSYRVTPCNPSRIAALEEEARESGAWASVFGDLSEVTTDPDAAARMYAYLLAQKSFIR